MQNAENGLLAGCPFNTLLAARREAVAETAAVGGTGAGVERRRQEGVERASGGRQGQHFV